MRLKNSFLLLLLCLFSASLAGLKICRTGSPESILFEDGGNASFKSGIVENALFNNSGNTALKIGLPSGVNLWTNALPGNQNLFGANITGSLHPDNSSSQTGLIFANSATSKVFTLTQSGDLYLSGKAMTLPATIDEANSQFSQRRANFVKAWALRHGDGSINENDSRIFGYPLWTHDLAATVCSEIAAGLYIFSHPDEFNPKYYAMYSGLPESAAFESHKAKFVSDLEAYTQHIFICAPVGTDTRPDLKYIPDYEMPYLFGRTDLNLWTGSADYDFVLLKLASIIYAFYNYPDVLTNNMVYNMIIQGPYSKQLNEAPYTGQDPDEFMQVRDLNTYAYIKNPETENHVLMIYQWKWLINDYIRNAADASSPRFDSRFKTVFDKDHARYTNGTDLTNMMCKILGRVVRRGMFETNAKAYESFSLAAILNLASYGNSFNFNNNSKVKTAALNAADYIIANFAFRSLECKSSAPMRRNYHYKDRYSFYDSYYVPHIVGMLTGGTVLDLSPGEQYYGSSNYPDETRLMPLIFKVKNNDPDKKPEDPPYKYIEGNDAALPLYASLGSYRVPKAIHEFILNRHDGWWTRAQTNYFMADADPSIHDSRVPGDYGVNITPGVFDPDPPADNRPWYGEFPDSVDANGHQNRRYPVSQEYFVTPDFVINAPGRNDQFGPTHVSGGLANWPPDYWQMPRPSMIITKGNYGFWGLNGNDLNAAGNDVFVTCKDLNEPWTNNNFNYYKSFFLTDGFVAYPPNWDNFKNSVSWNHGTINVWDFRTAKTGLKGYYLICLSGFLLSSDNSIWEIVPGTKYSSSDELINQIKSQTTYNSGFVNGHWYSDVGYKLQTSGEVVSISGSMYSSAYIRSITNNGVDMLSIYGCTPDPQDLPHEKRVPLIDVWQIDNNYNFTGVKYADNPVRGKIVIHNPYISGGAGDVILDATDVLNPVNSAVR